MLATCRAIGDLVMIAHALGRLGSLASQLGDHERAVALAEESLALSQQIGLNTAPGKR